MSPYDATTGVPSLKRRSRGAGCDQHRDPTMKIRRYVSWLTVDRLSIAENYSCRFADVGASK
jgi:hypothetical protein